MRELIRKWLGVTDIKIIEVPKIVEKVVTVIKEVPVEKVVIQEVIREVEVPRIVTCAHDGHDWGRMKQWIVDDKVVQNQKCKRCGVMK